MQIVRKGCGEKIKNGETVTVICRFTETNIMQDKEVLDNAHSYYYATLPDKMSVKNTSGTFSASFDPMSSLMYETYRSASVPAGWLTPMTFIKIGRPEKAEDEIELLAEEEEPVKVTKAAKTADVTKSSVAFV